MKNLCLFAAYNPENRIPYYVRVYLQELSRHATDLWFLSTHEPDEDGRLFLKQHNIHGMVGGNEGFDFGLWYKALKKIDASVYQNVFLINDSCILFKPLDSFLEWTKKTEADVYGMTSSDAVYPHLQSYFLMFGKKAIPQVLDYFEQNRIQTHLQRVIEVYEIGLSDFLIKRGLILKAFVDNNAYSGEFSPYYYCVFYHLRKGIPLIKKKILFCSYRNDELFSLARMNFKISSSAYMEHIRKEKELLLDLEKLKMDKRDRLGGFHIFYFHLMRITIQALNLFRGKIRTVPR